MHANFDTKSLTRMQHVAVEAAVSNRHPFGDQPSRTNDQANHFILLIQGAPRTGKSTVSLCIAYHCYHFSENLLISSGVNKALDHLAEMVLTVLPKSTQTWTVPGSIVGVYRLELGYDESWGQITRNAHAYGHEFIGDYEQHGTSFNIWAEFSTQISDSQFAHVEEYVKRRIATGRPLSLGDHILVRLRKAKGQRTQAQWTHDLYPPQISLEEYNLLWTFLSCRVLAARHDAFFLDILGEVAPQRKVRYGDLTDKQKAIANETAKAWRNLQSFYVKHARIIFCAAQTAGCRVMKSFRAHRVLIEEAAQLDEPSCLNTFVRSYKTLRKVIWSGDALRLSPTILSERLNEAAAYRRTSQMKRLMDTGVDFITLEVQF
jgi:hypothetical protein